MCTLLENVPRREGRQCCVRLVQFPLSLAPGNSHSSNTDGASLIILSVEKQGVHNVAV